MRFQFFPSVAGSWRWRLMLYEQTLAISGRDYSSEADCVAAIENIQTTISDEPVPIENISGLFR